MNAATTKIALLPGWSKSAASSRIRVYSLYDQLSRRGCDVSLEYRPGVKVLFVQKRISLALLRQARRVKAEGGIVIYDVDDVGATLFSGVLPPLFRAMVALADVVTTDTEGHRAYLLEREGLCSVMLLPDCVDYFPEAPLPVRVPTDDRLRVIWFGNIENFPVFEKYATALRALPRVTIVVATNSGAIKALAGKFENIEIVAWSLERFVEILRSCDCACLTHDGSEIDRMKSNNKMIAAISLGVPAVVSRTPEYERTAKESGIESCLFSDESELVEGLSRLSTLTARQQYLAVAQPEIWRRYSARAVSEIFLGLVDRMARNSSARQESAFRRLFADVSTTVSVGVRCLFTRIRRKFFFSSAN